MAKIDKRYLKQFLEEFYQWSTSEEQEQDYLHDFERLADDFVEKELDEKLLLIDRNSKKQLSVEENIYKWYKNKYKDDPTGSEINPLATFYGLENNISNVYDYIGVYETDIRHAVFGELARRMKVEYDDVFNIWLDGGNKHDKNS